MEAAWHSPSHFGGRMKFNILGFNLVDSIALVMFSVSPFFGGAMLVLRQIVTLTKKNLRLEVFRHGLSTTFRALLLPVAFVIFLAYAQNLVIAPASYGVGAAKPVLSLLDAMDFHGVPSKLVMVNNNFRGGEIDQVIGAITRPLEGAGKEVVILAQGSQLLSTCRETIRQISDCYAAAVFHSSPSEGSGGIWNYTIRIDAARGRAIDVHSSSNDIELYPIPLQHAIDWTIASLNGSVTQNTLSEGVFQYPFTDETEAERRDGVRTRYQNTIRTALATALFLGQIGVVYHLVGFMTYERERGISQLIEAMMPNPKRWQPQFARLLSYHLSFVLIYLPGWVIISIVLKYVVFVHTNLGVLLGFYVLSGLALTSSAIFGAAFFRRTQLSAITVTGISLILAILGMVFGSKGNWTVGLLSLFFPPITVINFIDELTYWEIDHRSIHLYLGAPGRASRLPGLVYWYCLILQILVFPLLASFVERCLYSARSSHRSVTRTGNPSAHPIRLEKFSKVYQPKWYSRLLPAAVRRSKSPVRAVDGVTSSIGRGQITVLLGPNGSGKTTTLKCIAGIESPTGGLIEVDGVGGLGICPQENVFWDLLTVEEHVQILSALKRVVGVDPVHTVHDLIRSCDLEAQTHALAKTLSGGQKRKLQLAMMFTAGSQICCVDEVSSGLDPQSRRKIWEILLAKRGERTIVLTTHFLDEVDYLADRVIIISQGSIRAEGSTVDLKQRWGGGYSVQVTEAADARHRGEFESSHILQALPRHATISVERSPDVINTVDELEARGVTDYRIRGPSMENVFFNVLGQTLPSGDIAPDSALDLQPAQPGGLLRFIWILFVKRFIILRRNLMPHILALVIVPLAAGIASIFLIHYDGLKCGSDLALTIPTIYTPSSLQTLDFVIGPSSQISPAVLQHVATLAGAEAALGLSASTQSLHFVESLDDFNQFISTQYANVTPGGVFLGSGSSPPTFAYHANGPLYHAIFTQNILNTLITNVSTNAQFSEFASTSQIGLGNSMQFILYFGLAMTTYAAVFALYPTTERQQHIRVLHYSNGLRALPLWIAYTVFDFSFVLVASVITVVVLRVVFHAWFALGYLFVVLVLFGLASLLLSFVVSLFAKSQLAAFAFSAGGQAIMFVVYIVVYLSILTNSSSQNVDKSVDLAYYLLAIFMPPGSLARALLVSLNISSISCDGSTLVSYPGDIKAYGGPILYLLLQSVALFGFLVWWESGPRLTGFRRRVRVQHHEEAELADADILSEVQRVIDSEDGLRVLHACKDFGHRRVVDDVTFGVAANEIFTLLGPNGAGKTTLMALIRGELTLSEKRGEILVRGFPLSKNLASLRAHLGFCPQFDAIDAMTVTEHLQLYAKIRGVSNINANVQQILQLMGLVPFANRLGAQLSGGYKRRLSLGIALIGNPEVLLLDEPSSGLDAVAKRAIWQTIKAASRGRSIVLTTHSMEEAEALADRAGIMERRMLALGTVGHLRQRYGDSYTIHLVCRSAPHTSDEEMERLRRWIVENIEDASLEDKSLHGQLKFSVPANKNTNRLPDTRAQLRLRRPSSQETGIVGPGNVDDISSAISVSRVRSRHGAVRTIFAVLETHRELLDLESYSVAPSALEEVFFNVVENQGSTDDELLPSRWWRRRRD